MFHELNVKIKTNNPTYNSSFSFWIHGPDLQVPYWVCDKIWKSCLQRSDVDDFHPRVFFENAQDCQLSTYSFSRPSGSAQQSIFIGVEQSVKRLHYNCSPKKASLDLCVVTKDKKQLPLIHSFFLAPPSSTSSLLILKCKQKCAQACKNYWKWKFNLEPQADLEKWPL